MRSVLVRWPAAVVMAALVCLLEAAPAAASSGSPLQSLINRDRAGSGLAPLSWSTCLENIALQNAQRIANQGYLSHTNGPTLDLACGAGATQAGENIAYISSGIDDNQVNTMYMNSPGHRANILGPYTYVATAWVVASNGYAYNAEEFLGAASLLQPVSAPTTFYFAEGFTGTGYTERLSMLMPSQSGTATIDYYTRSGHLPTITVPLVEGVVMVENVNTDVGTGQDVSAKVTLPGPGVVERTIHFNTGARYGSTDVVGANQPNTEWDFAEGSTFSAYSEYLTLQNPNPSPINVTLNYFTDGGAHPVKALTLAAASRTTVEVASGDLSNNPNCTPGAGGTCGVGSGIGGVSVQLLSGAPIIAERPFYVNGFNFGSGVIRDGHDAFGASGPAKDWYFAEGTTSPGFNEYLTLENPGSAQASVSLRYLDNMGRATTRGLLIDPRSRVTVAVFGTAYGVGPGVGGVSVQVTSDQPIVAERPMYMVCNFGTGAVAGAHVAVGARSLGTLFGFAALSTVTGDDDFLTIQNPNSVTANLALTYFTGTGSTTRAVSISPNTRQTVLLFQSAGGPGPGLASAGMVVSSDQPILVEKPTYSSNSTTYGATDATGYPFLVY